MNVKIKTVYGELSFNMENADALALISAASKFAEAYAYAYSTDTDQRNDALPALMSAKIVADALADKNESTAKKPATKSRLESIFGKRSEWKLPDKEQTAAPAEATEEKTAPDTEAPVEDEPQTYQGFMYIECEKCGALKGFCVKQPITYHRCECGHKTELHDLRAAHVKCECGSKFKYHTNIQSNAFTISCLHCDSPVDMELGSKGTAFVTVAFSEMYKQRGSGKR